VRITLEDLKKEMAPLSEIGKGESSFEVMGVQITLRALAPDEEIDVQRFARSVLSEGDLNDQINALEYLDRFRTASLGYSIVQIGDLDFRDVEVVETGEKLANGTSVKLRKHEAIQRLISSGGWSRQMVVAVYRKFGELHSKVEKEVEGLIEFEPVDYDTEISRLQDQIRELQEEKLRMSLSETDSRTSNREKVLISSTGASKKPATRETSETQRSVPEESTTVVVPSDVVRTISEDSDEKEEMAASEDGEEYMTDVDGEEASSPPSPSPPRSSVFDRVKEPGKVSPPSQVAASRPFPQVAASRPLPQVAASRPLPDPMENRDDLSDVVSSMVDTNDPDSLDKAVEAETQRIIEMRRHGRTPPHMNARQVAESLQPVEQPSLVGKRDGIEVYKMPTQNIGARGKAVDPVRPVAPAPVRGNPRFTPTKS